VSAPEEPLAALGEALVRTRAAGTARAMLDEVWKPRPDLRVRSRGIGGALDRLAMRALKATFLRNQVGEGAIDLAGHRCMLDFGEWATLDTPTERWSGRSGTRLADLRPEPAEAPKALSLLEALGTAGHVSPGEDREVRGDSCRGFLAVLDLSRDPELATAFAVADDLRAVPVDVWLDRAHLRRVRFAVPLYEVTLELWDVGRAGDLDWTRLPTFRTAAD
jgi:hypothetical protein